MRCELFVEFIILINTSAELENYQGAFFNIQLESRSTLYICMLCPEPSVTRFGNLYTLDNFSKPVETNFVAQIAHIFMQFLYRLKRLSFF